MSSLLTSTTARLGTSILAALGLVPIVACGSDVVNEGQGGSSSTTSPVGPGGGNQGGGHQGGGSNQGGGNQGGGGAGAGLPDHPPTCDELASASHSVGVVSMGHGGGFPSSPFACENPQARTVGCLDTGVDSCDGGWLARREAVECPSWHRTDFTCSAGDPGFAECTKDSDCGNKGYCESYFAGSPAGNGCECATTCATDADCGDGKLCLCGEPGGQCVDATCRTDADCGGGLRCASYVTGDACNPTVAFTCQTVEDECITGSDCSQDQMGEMQCNPGVNGVRACEGGGGCMAAGRPLVVEGQMRLADLSLRTEWIEPASCRDLPEHLREAVAAGWTHIALMEHASIASFARFAMDLLSLGAPPELVSEAARAMADETEHARLAFGIASELTGVALGPTALDVTGANGAGSLVELAVATFLEGCIAEGVASAEAAIAASYAVDPTIRSVQERIAVEEGRHAELGWKTIAWALRVDRAAVAPALAEALARAEAIEIEEVEEPGLEAYGLLGPRERSAVRQETLATVVRPILARLLGVDTQVATAHA